MSDQDEKRLERKFDRLRRALPESVGRLLHGLWGPPGRFVRVPIALLLIAGGFVGFLPVLGFWMVPIGVILLARDLPFLRAPTVRTIEWVERKWAAWRGR